MDVAHVWSTGWRVLADGADAHERLALYAGVPLLAWAAGVAAYSVSALVFWRVLAYLAVFHFVRQQYGWVALYRRKNGEGPEGALSRRLDAAVVYGATLTPLLFWHAHLPRRFQWFLQGDFLGGPAARGLARRRSSSSPPSSRRGSAKEIARARGRAPRLVGQGPRRPHDRRDVVPRDRRLRLGLRVHGDERLRPRDPVPGPRLVHVEIARRARAARRARLPRSRTAWLASLPLFLLPLLAIAFAEEWGWDRLVWHDHPRFFPGAAAEPGALALVLLVPLLALPQATHYVWDAFLWKVKPANAGAVGALGIR